MHDGKSAQHGEFFSTLPPIKGVYLAFWCWQCRLRSSFYLTIDQGCVCSPGHTLILLSSSPNLLLCFLFLLLSVFGSKFFYRIINSSIHVVS